MTLVHYSPFLAYKKMLGCDAQNNRVIGIDWKEFVLDAMATTVCYPHQMHLGEKKVTSIPYSGSRHGLRTPNESFFFQISQIYWPIAYNYLEKYFMASY